MSLNDLVTSQPVQEVPTPSEPENAPYVDNGDNAPSTPVNEAVEEQGNEQDEQPQGRAPKRIEQLLGERDALRDQLLKETAAREAIERNLEHFQPTSNSDDTKLSDLSVDKLEEFINQAHGNEDLEQYIPEANRLLVKKQVDQQLSQFEQTKSEEVSLRDGKDLTNLMLRNMAGEKLSDTSSDYFQTIQGTLYDLEQAQYKYVNKDQLLAVALAEIDYLKSKANGPTLPEKIIENRNTTNTVLSNNRSANYGGSGLNDILSESGGRLTKSKQGKSGSLRDAIKQFSAVKSIGE